MFNFRKKAPILKTHLDEVPMSINLENMNCLMLNGKDCQCILVQIKALIMGQKYFVSFKSCFITESALLNINNIKSVVFKGIARIRTDTLIIPTK